MELNIDIFSAFNKSWALLTAGSMDEKNAMTISWGSMGTLWGKPIVTVYVKPVRYTHSFMEKSDVFTVSFFPEAYRKALTLLGTKSGRDGDKIGEAGLHPVKAGEGVGYEEAKLTLVCKKIYTLPFDRAAIPQEAIHAFYETEEPHTMFVGEVLQIIPEKQEEAK